MATLSHDPLWPRAGDWPALADLDPGASVDLVLLGVPAWRTSLSPTNAHATPGAIREALRRYSPALMPDRAGAGGHARDLGELRFADAVEETAYFIVSEALANVAKHAHARRPSSDYTSSTTPSSSTSPTTE